MNITHILSAVLLSMDEKEYKRDGGDKSRYVKNYERRSNMKRNYSTSDRYPEITSQFMRR